jgi:hypothetical protein
MKTIIRKLGLAALDLEDFYPLIEETLKGNTLSTFSQFFPYSYIITKDLSKERCEVWPDFSRVYYLSDRFLDDNRIDIISVQRVDGASSFLDYNAPLQRFNIDEMILEGVASNVRSLMNISTRGFEFMPPNRIKLIGYSGTEEVKITVKIPYPSFGAVPESLSIVMEKLAILDVKLVLYPELKQYENLDSYDGQIDLKISDWGDAESQRDQLIEDFRNKGFPNSVKNPYTYE